MLVLRDYAQDAVVNGAHAHGFADVNIPVEMQCEVKFLLSSLKHYVHARHLVHWVVDKEKGGHATDWWLYCKLDIRNQKSRVQFGETVHDEVNSVPHLWIHGKQNWIGIGHTLLKRFLRWRRASLYEEYSAIARAKFDGSEYAIDGYAYLTFEKGARLKNLPIPPGSHPQGWSYGRIGKVHGWYPPHFADRVRSTK